MPYTMNLAAYSCGRDPQPAFPTGLGPIAIGCIECSAMVPIYRSYFMAHSEPPRMPAAFARVNGETFIKGRDIQRWLVASRDKVLSKDHSPSDLELLGEVFDGLIESLGVSLLRHDIDCWPAGLEGILDDDPR